MLVLDRSSGEIVTETTIRKSRFVATLAAVSTEAELAALIARKRDPSANHACWGAVIGSGPGQIARCSDDGEPGGTAGPPILAALQSREVTGAAIVVVRWFGGIKLGAGGLVRAYGGAAGAVLDAAPLRAARERATLRLRVPIEMAGRVEKVLYAAGDVGAVDYGAESVTFTVDVAAAAEAALRDRVLSVTSGAAEVLDAVHHLA
ncbi:MULTISPECIES: IMPACT family protein [unclassified Gordonia (in: high G+C Gram-positive bacteria)]|uniref:IMPACT family protein n=1 Tax=unclassified Gordonia (in: high G+C Gram-positive bacteria) TaxID=2657482 RepID=UPI001FFF0E75|nr:MULTISPECIES: YigZ family protein [unclassified Gordonia (in: high G+C Gram-positive bacteria)]UQE73557.1 YigZ family protein [Gordonia sp. PP30]